MVIYIDISQLIGYNRVKGTFCMESINIRIYGVGTEYNHIDLSLIISTS